MRADGFPVNPVPGLVYVDSRHGCDPVGVEARGVDDHVRLHLEGFAAAHHAHHVAVLCLIYACDLGVQDEGV
jgi:hypothetical protein